MSQNRDQYRTAMRYAGWGTQMLVLLGIAVWGGHKLDERIGMKALLVIIFPLAALTLSLWQLMRTLNKNK
jgi:hypothetical protein